MYINTSSEQANEIERQCKRDEKSVIVSKLIVIIFKMESKKKKRKSSKDICIVYIII